MLERLLRRMKRGRIIWLTGQPGAGKSTLAEQLHERGLVDFVIDGDELRAIRKEGFDERGRHANVARAQDIALFLSNEGKNVAVAVVAPYRAQRESLKQRADVIEVYVHTQEQRGREAFHVPGYEPPRAEYLSIDTGLLSVGECIERIQHAIEIRRAEHEGAVHGALAQ